MYEHIDMKKTGLLLKYRIEKAGYTVKDIQKILQLSCLCIEQVAEGTYGRFACAPM